jgi:hypothetical protein
LPAQQQVEMEFPLVLASLPPGPALSLRVRPVRAKQQLLRVSVQV